MKNFKKLVSLLLVFAMMFSIVACSRVDDSSSNNTSNTNTTNTAETLESGSYHIGIISATVVQSEDGLRAAEKALEIYGDANDGGMIVHDTYPDNFMTEQETTISKIVAMASDPDMKAIIVTQSVPGTVAAFEQIREINPDIKLISIIPQEDPSMIDEVSDLVIDADNISRGYRIVAAAKELGATKFVHISFPRHMSIELLALRRAIMEAACEELGLEFISETAPDPTSDVGIPGAQQYITEQIPQWIAKYGQDTAFFCTNDAHTEPLLRGVAAGGAIFVEQDLPSPILGYPGAFSIDLTAESGDWEAINAKVEEVVVDAGGAGRMGSWAYSFEYSLTLGAVDLAIDVIENGADITDMETVLSSIENYTGDAKWMGIKYIDRANGETKDNHLLVAQDTYVYGLGYLGMDEVEVPEEYMNMNIEITEE